MLPVERDRVAKHYAAMARQREERDEGMRAMRCG